MNRYVRAKGAPIFSSSIIWRRDIVSDFDWIVLFLIFGVSAQLLTGYIRSEFLPDTMTLALFSLGIFLFFVRSYYLGAHTELVVSQAALRFRRIKKGTHAWQRPTFNSFRWHEISTIRKIGNDGDQQISIKLTGNEESPVVLQLPNDKNSAAKVTMLTDKYYKHFGVTVDRLTWLQQHE
jgi:hypothetical protein